MLLYDFVIIFLTLLTQNRLFSKSSFAMELGVSPAPVVSSLTGTELRELSSERTDWPGFSLTEQRLRPKINAKKSNINS